MCKTKPDQLSTSKKIKVIYAVSLGHCINNGCKNRQLLVDIQLSLQYVRYPGL